MKIIIVGNPNVIHVRRYVQDLSKRGHEIHLVGEHKLTKSPPEGCTFYDLTRQINVRKLRYLYWPVELRRLVRAIKPDIIHAIGIASAGWLASSSGFHPRIVTAIGSDLMLLDQRGLAHRLLSKFTIRNADQVICVSRALYKRAVELGSRENKTHAIYVGINTTVYKIGDKTAAREKLGLPDKPLVLSIRAMAPVYRPVDLAMAIPKVLAAIPDAQFAILVYNVDQPTYDTFQRIVQAAGAEKSVLYIKEIHNEPELALYYQASDLAISIPDSDGTPTSVLEAMACGLPVIATDLPSLREWIVPDHNGLLVKVGDINTLAKAIIDILGDPARSEKIGLNASEEGTQRWDREKCLDQLEQVYGSVL